MREDSLQILYRLDPNPRKASDKADELKYYIEALESRMIVDSRDIPGWKMRSCVYNGYEDYTYTDDWHEVSIGQKWGGDDMTGLFRAEVVMPPVMENAQVFLNLSFGGEALLSVNDVPLQGVDFDRKLVNLDRHFAPGQKLDLYVEAGVRNAPYDSFRQDIRVHHVFETAKIVQIDKTIEDLYYYCWVLFDVCKAATDKEYAQFLMDHLEKALKLVNYRAASLEEFRAGAANAIEYIKQNIYASKKFHKNGKVSVIGQSHLDLVYMWPYKEFLRKNPRTATNMVRNLEEFPDFRFSQSQARLYEELREKYPTVYAEVKEKISQGRWEPVGAFYVEPDCNLIGGESMIRQIMWGKRYYQKEFGVDPQVCWVPDVFGCMGTMPQILKKSGVKYMSTIKLAIWNDTNEFPFSQFWWEGPDGSRVLTYFPGTHFVASAEPAKICEAWDSNKQKDITGESFFQFGLADGGGGATRDMVARMDHMRGLPGMPEMEFDTIQNFFERLETKSDSLPVWKDELYLETHRGTYTTKGQLKKENRQLEFALHEAEWLNAVVRCLGGDSRQAELDKAWENLMVNQFHDIIPGSHVTQSALDAMELYAEARNVIDKVRAGCLDVLAAKIGGGAVAVLNALSWNRNDIVSVAAEPGKSYVCARDCATGEEVPCVMKNGEDGACVQFEVSDVPAMGYKLFELIEGDAENNAADKKADCVETSQFVVRFDENGEIASIWDKIYQRELVEGGTANRFQIFEDRPGKYSAWDILASYKNYEYENACCLKELYVAQENELYTVVRMVKTVLDSEIRQDIVIHNKLHRIDFETQIEWKECEKLLKVAFPVSVRARSATYDIPFGTIQRSTHESTSWDRAKFEVCAHKWADLSEHNFGVSLLNNCKYGYDIRENVMRLSLLKAPIYPDPVSDRGHHSFTYSLFPHSGSWQEGGTMQQAYQLNMPLRAVSTADCPVSEMQQSWFECSDSNFILETVKEAEDGSGIILRGYDAYGQRGSVQMKGACIKEQACVTDLLENDGDALDVQADSVTVPYKPFEIVTVKCK